MTFPIPEAALQQHIAVLGKTGGGKTITAKLIVEHVVAQGARVCILDTIKSDWWGLTSSADGKHPGLPFHILGGPHGHVPLHSGAGAAIGDLVATGDLPLSIIDMAEFEPGGVPFFFKQWGEWHPCEMKDGVCYQFGGPGPFDPWKTPIFDPDQETGINFRRLGKKRAGALLDGREHKEFPI